MARELATLDCLVSAHVDSGLSADVVITSLYRSWSDRISSLPQMTTPEATDLTIAINSGPWRAQEKRALSELVMQHVGPSPRRSPRCNRRQNQSCLTFENFLNMADWAKLRSNTLRGARIVVVAYRAFSLNIELPTEPTLYRFIKMIAYGERCSVAHVDFDQGLVDTTKEKVRAAISAHFLSSKSRRDPTLPFIVNYPLTPHELPDALRTRAYECDGTVPESVHIPELDTILAGTQVRGGSKASTPRHGCNMSPTRCKAS